MKSLLFIRPDFFALLADLPYSAFLFQTISFFSKL